MDKIRGTVDKPATILHVEKCPIIQASEVPDVKESPMKLLNVALKSG